jgi:hypothetical protein
LIHKAVLKVTETVFNLKVNIMVNHKKIISAILLPFFLLGIAIVFLAMNPEKIVKKIL